MKAGKKIFNNKNDGRGSILSDEKLANVNGMGDLNNDTENNGGETWYGTDNEPGTFSQGSRLSERWLKEANSKSETGIPTK